MNKVTWICSQLEPMYDTGLCETPWERSYPVTWVELDPVGLDQVDRVLNVVSITTCQLDPFLPGW